MTLRMRLHRAGTTLLLLLGTTLLAGAAPALAEDTVAGHALVEGTDLVARTVTLRGQTYQVTSQTKLLDLDGHRTDLEQLRSKKPTGPLIDPSGGDIVFFQASNGPGGRVLQGLRVVEHMPK